VASIATSSNPEKRPLNLDIAPPNPLHAARLNDLGIRIVMIPLFGVLVPHLTGYLGPLSPVDPRYWLGLVWGCLISFCIWHGNRFFLIKQREHYDWFQHPVRKLAVLVFASIFYTSACTITLTLAWFRFAGLQTDWVVIRSVTLASVVCVLFITHVYETVYLIQQRESDLLTFERLQRTRIEAELEALKTQVAPHFLFNSLNTLSWLIENSPPKALDFNQNLAEVYRYILLARRRELVPLSEELEFLEQYFSLLKIRFEDSLALRISPPGDRLQNWYIPPISLQVLVENAVKHNEHSPLRPLMIDIGFESAAVRVANEKRGRASILPAAGVGVKSLDDRCRLVLGRGLDVSNSAADFVVLVPVQVS
jgi:hypothetical protein